MEQTCGVFFFNPDGKILICHVTNSGENTWSIPKGRRDNGEEVSHTASRELREETSLDIPADRLIHIGEASYRKQPRELVAYAYHSKSKLDTDTLKCDSIVKPKNGGRDFPEVDAYKFIDPSEAEKFIHHTQVTMLKKYLELK